MEKYKSQRGFEPTYEYLGHTRQSFYKVYEGTQHESLS